MSTKSTILYGENFHIYEECMTDDVYLEVSAAKGEVLDFSVHPDRVTVLLPAELVKILKKDGLSILTKRKQKRLTGKLASLAKAYGAGKRLSGGSL